MNLAPFLSGPIIANVDPEAKDLRKVSLDLTPTDINLPFLGWHKLPGVAAQFTAHMEKSDYGLQFSRVRFSGEGFSASGEFAIDASGALADLSARNIQLRPDERFSISARQTRGRFKAQVSGETIDVRGIISALQHPAGEGSEAASQIDITVNVDRLIGHNGVEISNIDGKASIVGGAVDTLSIMAGPEGSHSIEVAADEETGGRKMVARFSDAGTILRFANVYRTAYGGGMTMEFTSPPETDDGKGHIGISGFLACAKAAAILPSGGSVIPFSRRDQTINIFKANLGRTGPRRQRQGSDQPSKPLHVDPRDDRADQRLEPVTGVHTRLGRPAGRKEAQGPDRHRLHSGRSAEFARTEAQCRFRGDAGLRTQDVREITPSVTWR